ncbi:hypothetical protein FE783_24355 [Paenibacillus mesophilus]|uniref:hypothetical protein n=1 Tax=Paenibacillus mesophilus TaxID=2582849 RepID=UPI00110E3E20|nr:hypothetical protein [Paenibacillus mesophilus]TMV47050.1 hypothetical protein FE783_24355 [Paenibacillus mesophilus]
MLNISVIEQDNGRSYQLIIPNTLQKDIPYLMTEIRFQAMGNSNALLVSEDSFLVKKLAELVTRKNNSFSMGSARFPIKPKLQQIMNKFSRDCNFEMLINSEDRVLELHMWVRITVQGFFLEEKLEHYTLNMNSGRIERCESTNVPDLEPLMELRDKRIDLVQRSIEKLTEHAKSNAGDYAHQKKAEVQQFLNDEISRIETYFRKLEIEATSGSLRNKSALDELELLAAEKGNLIDQLNKKYQVDSDQVKLEIVALLALEKQVERIELLVKSPYGQATLDGDGDRGFNVLCSVTSNREGAFTVTSDNWIVLQSQTFLCKTCGKLKQKELSESCVVCECFICKECALSSVISKQTLCNDQCKILYALRENSEYNRIRCLRIVWC